MLSYFLGVARSPALVRLLVVTAPVPHLHRVRFVFADLSESINSFMDSYRCEQSVILGIG